MDLPEMQPKSRVVKSLMHVPYQAPPMSNNLNFQYRQLPNKTDCCLEQVGNKVKKRQLQDSDVSPINRVFLPLMPVCVTH